MSKATSSVANPKYQQQQAIQKFFPSSTNDSRPKLRIFVTTWNMGNAEPEGFQNVFEQQEVTRFYDLVVIGLQESTYQSKGAGTDSIAHLGGIINNILGPTFYRVAHCYRAQLQLYVFAKKQLERRICDVEMSIENTGILHVFPNKGGLLVTLTIDGTKLAFVSCHLAAHEGVKKCEERNASIVEILGGVRAGDKRIDITEQFHHVFWMGDMNYRLTFDPTEPENTKKNLEEYHRQLDVKSTDVQVHFNSSFKNENSGEISDNNNNNNNSSKKNRPVSTSSKKKQAADYDDDDDDEFDEDEDENGNTGKKAERAANMRKILDMIVREQWEDLLELDELNREIRARRVLNDFIALQPSFPPTFKRTRQLVIGRNDSASSGKRKYQLRRGSNAVPLSEKTTSANDDSNYDLTSTSTPTRNSVNIETQMVSSYYHHKRLPSYTDRILYKSMSAFKDWVQPLYFESCEEALSSDHKPVRAGFELQLSRGVEDIFVDQRLLRAQGKKSNAQNSEGYTLKMKVFDLKGQNLEEMDSQLFGGGSDPYIVITTDPAPLLLSSKGKLQSQPVGVTSKVIKHDLNPVWSDTLRLQLASIDFDGLTTNASLIFSVWDEDQYNKDDLIGVITFPLRGILQTFALGRPFFFNDFIRSNSEVMGKLSGTIQLDGDFRELYDAYNRDLLNDRSNGTPRNYMTLGEAVREAELLANQGCNQGCNCSMS